MLIDSCLSLSDHIRVVIGVSSQVEQILEFAVSVGERVSLPADQVVRTFIDIKILLQKSKGELNDTTNEVSEVLVKYEGLDSWEDGEWESLEDLFEPDLVAYSAINVAHIDIIIK